MKVNFKLQKKVYVKLITYISRLDADDFLTIDLIDLINIREMYIDSLMKHERWRNDKNYHAAKKLSTIIIDINKFRTLQKIFNEMRITECYEYNLLHIICNQVTPQIKKQHFLNQQIIN